MLRRIQPPRAALLVLAVAGCAGPPRPAVLRSMPTLPDEPVERGEELDSIASRPTEDVRRPLPRKLRRIEEVALGLASVAGFLFSSNPNTLIGVGAAVDENLLFDPGYREKARAGSAKGGDGDGDEAAAPEYDPNELLPWLRLGPPDGRGAPSPSP